MSIRFALAIVFLAPAVACSTGSTSLDVMAERYVRAALRLAQHDPALVEDWRGPDSWRPGPRIPVAALLDEIANLQEQLEIAASDISSGHEYARVRYLVAQVRGLRFAAERQLGRSTTLDEQAREEFGVTFPPFDASAAERARAALLEVLTRDGAAHERVAAFRKQIVVARERREHVSDAALDACRRATTAVVPLPGNERIDVRFDANLTFDAFARYRGDFRSDLEISDGGPLDAARALRLACHEGYPGHHTQYVLLDQLFGDRHWPELRLYPAFGPHVLFLEGAAEVGADVAFTATQRQEVYRTTLLPAAGLDPTLAARVVRVEELLQALLPVVTDVAREYLDGALTRERAIERLTNEALVTNPSATLAFIEQRRARALVYVEGREVVYGMMKTRDLAGLYAAFKAVAAVQ